MRKMLLCRAAMLCRRVLLLPGVWLMVSVVGSTTEQPSRVVDIDAVIARDVCVTKQRHNMASSIQPLGTQ